jgi:hypothetical protein
MVVAPDESFAITLPPGWQAAFTLGNARRIGEQLFPDDPAHGALVAQLLPHATGETRMIALIPAPEASSSPIPAAALQVDRHLVTGERSTSGAVDYIREWTLHDTAQILGQGTFDAARGPVVWVEFQVPGDAFIGVWYLTTAGDWEWTVTYWTRAPDYEHALGDQIVASLTPLPAASPA